MKTPRRGTVGIGAGASLTTAVLGHAATIPPDEHSWVHAVGLAAGIATTIAPFLIEKVKDYLSERTGGRVDLDHTASALIEALRDGSISREEVKDVLGAGVDDVAEMFEGYEHDGLGEEDAEEPASV